MPTRARLLSLGLLLSGFAVPTLAQPPAEKPAEKKADKTAKTKLTVTLPEEDADLKIEGKKTEAKGKTRTFEIPPLDAGVRYEYKLTATWSPNNYTVITRNKTVVFEAGKPVAADLTADDPLDKATIRYVPTPDDVVAEMIKLAKVTKDDIVYEPGCGDARIVVAAVKAGAKKGVGIDIDPERVTESKATVKAAKLEDKIEIRLGDALDIQGFPEATVVFMYMGDEFNALMRPYLWQKLKVGTRVVSHRFTMGDWKPEKTIQVKGEDGDEYELHLWTITKEVKEKAEAMGKKDAKGEPKKDEKKEEPKKDEKKKDKAGV